MQNRLVGRKKECSELDAALQSGRSEFVIIYGRRRVGKTFLIEQHFHSTFDFSYVGGHNLSLKLQLRKFTKALQQYTCNPDINCKDWYDAFDALENHLGNLPTDKKKVIFIDEMPWIDTLHSEFVSALEYFWNGWANRRNDIMLIASGSASSWMMDKLVDNQGGLHARITRSIYLEPFTLAETEQYMKSVNCPWDRYQILQCYMLLGGVPFYLSLLDPQDSLVRNIDRLFFAKKAILRLEFDELYHALFTTADKYIVVAKLLAEHPEGLTKKELEQYTKFSGSLLKKLLTNLERCDFITQFNQHGNNKKGTIFKLIDFYTLFYYKYIENNHSNNTTWWTTNYNSPSVIAWYGRTFEVACLLHITQIKKALGIEGISSDVSSWRSYANQQDNTPGHQIDLIIDRADRMINICEIKFSTGPYKLTTDYENKIRNRASAFKDASKTTKGINCTFITTYGIANANAHSIVGKQITMDDLFE